MGLVYWTGLVEFFRNLYWFQLQNGGITKEIFLVAYLFSPPLVLSHPVLRGYVQGHIWSRPLLLLCGLVGIGGQFAWSALMRLAFSGTTVGILGIYVIDSLWAVSRARRRRAAFGMIGGILLLQVLRWVNIGVNPLVARWWGFLLLGIIPGVGTALLLLTEDVSQLEAEAWEDNNPPVVDSGSDDEYTEGISLIPIVVDPVPKELRTLRIQESATHSPRSSRRSSPRGGGGLRDMVNTSSPLKVNTSSPLQHVVVDDGEDVRRWKEGEEVPWLPRSVDTDDSDVDDETFRPRRWKFKASVAWRTVQMGVGSGCLWFLTHWLFTAPTTVARWLGVSVSWNAPLVIVTLGLGMALAAEAAR